VTSPNRESRANGLLWSLCCNDQSIQPVQAFYLEVAFYHSRPGRGASPKYNASPKESVSCASAVLFLLCVSRYVLFLLCFNTAFYCSCTRDIAEPVPTFEMPVNPGAGGEKRFFVGRERPGFRYRKPRCLLRDWSGVTVVYKAGAPRTRRSRRISFRWRRCFCGGGCPVAGDVPTSTCD
jgi:hypothetical protein